MKENIFHINFENLLVSYIFWMLLLKKLLIRQSLINLEREYTN